MLRIHIGVTELGVGVRGLNLMVAPKPFSSDPPHRHTMHRPDSIREWTLGIRMGRSHARVHGGQQEFGIGIPLFAVLPYLPCNGGQRVRYSGAFDAL